MYCRVENNLHFCSFGTKLHNAKGIRQGIQGNKVPAENFPCSCVLEIACPPFPATWKTLKLRVSQGIFCDLEKSGDSCGKSENFSAYFRLGGDRAFGYYS